MEKKFQCLWGKEEEHPVTDSTETGVREIRMDLFSILCGCTGWEEVVRMPKEMKVGSGNSVVVEWVRKKRIFYQCTIGSVGFLVSFRPYKHGHTFKIEFDGEPWKVKEFRKLAKKLEYVTSMTGFLTQEQFSWISERLTKRIG